MHNISNNDSNANFVLSHICSFFLYLHQIRLVNVKLNISRILGLYFKVQSSFILFISNGRAKTNLVILSLLYCGEFMKTSIECFLLFGFFAIRKSDAFLSDYLTDLKFHSTK